MLREKHTMMSDVFEVMARGTCECVVGINSISIEKGLRVKTEPGLERTDCEFMTDPNSGTQGSGRKMETATSRQTHVSRKRGDPGPGGDSSVLGEGSLKQSVAPGGVMQADG